MISLEQEFYLQVSTGENKIFGEVLLNAQGEDIVAGIEQKILNFKSTMPNIYNES